MDESVQKHLEQQQITKLSQAIREGAKLRHKCDGQPFFAGGSCALGAAYEALGGWVTKDIEDETWGAWKFVTERLGLDAEIRIFDDGIGTELWDEIATRNDGGNYTREQIADWLEGQGY